MKSFVFSLGQLAFSENWKTILLCSALSAELRLMRKMSQKGKNPNKMDKAKPKQMLSSSQKISQERISRECFKIKYRKYSWKGKEWPRLESSRSHNLLKRFKSQMQNYSEEKVFLRKSILKKMCILKKKYWEFKKNFVRIENIHLELPLASHFFLL